jgi:hypothetical protein
MKKSDSIYDSYVLDTCKLASSGKYLPGAIITFKGRKRIEIIQWKKQMFDSQDEADAFVKEHFQQLGFAEPTNEIEIYNHYPAR